MQNYAGNNYAHVDGKIKANVEELHHVSSMQSEENNQETSRKKKETLGRTKKKSYSIYDVPRQPLTGYVRFLNDHREKVRAENQKASFRDITKILASQWSTLPSHEKQKYLDDAENDKKKCMKELEQYRQTEAYKIFTQKQQEKKLRDNEDRDGNSFLNSSGMECEDGYFRDDAPGLDISIFTEEFLDHNKVRETELRQLRKSNTEFEEQNAILSKHVDNMRVAIDKLEVETIQQKNNNIALQKHLDNLRKTLTANFASIPLPGTSEVPSIESIDNYMAKLHNMTLDNPQENEALISTVREIVNRLDYQGSERL